MDPENTYFDKLGGEEGSLLFSVNEWLGCQTTITGSEPFKCKIEKDHRLYLMETKYSQQLG